jgi:hypothetical protein
MSILTACQKAAIKLLGGGASPLQLFGTDDEFAVELRTLANEAAEAVAKAHDWRRLTILKTQGGDGSDTSFALPADFDRMPLKAHVWSTTRDSVMTPARDLDQWLDFQLTSIVGSPGFWIILGGELGILPAMSASESAKYYYVSKYLWAVDGSTTASKAYATADADTFVLPERLITLGVVWRWKQMKGKEYGEDLQNFNFAFGEEAGREKGSRVLHVGRPRFSGGVELAYPGTITG